MEQLLKVTSTRFQSIHFSQSARLVPTSSIDIERRKAMARHFAFRSRYAAKSVGPDLKSVNQINQAFYPGRTSVSQAVSSPEKTISKAEQTAQLQLTSNFSSGSDSLALRQVSMNAMAPVVNNQDVYSDFSAPPVQTTEVQTSNYVPHSQAAYNIERGSFEMRVAKGELSYVPALEMTIITQYPEIHFEYLGGFNYVPPSADPNNNVNITI